MVAQPVRHEVSLAYVAAGIAHSGLVVTKQEVDPGPLGLVPLEQVGQVGATGGQDMARPVRDLRGRQAARRAVDEEQLDLLATHAPIISSTSDTSAELVRRPEKAAVRRERRSAAPFLRAAFKFVHSRMAAPPDSWAAATAAA